MYRICNSPSIVVICVALLLKTRVAPTEEQNKMTRGDKRIMQNKYGVLWVAYINWYNTNLNSSRKMCFLSVIFGFVDIITSYGNKN